MSTDTVQNLRPAVPGRRRLPAHWNIGLDFGTAFTKCVVRRSGQECYVVPFETCNGLLPSEILVGKDSLWLPTDAARESAVKRVLHLKMALAESSCGKLGNTWLCEFCANAGLANGPETAARIENLTAYFLARVVAKARDFVRQKTPDFGEVQGDRLFANLAIPISHEEEANVSSTFQRSFRKAWLLEQQPGFENVVYSEIETFLEKQRERLNEDLGCYIYPEVSANVQSYIKSRAGSDGLYLFVDVGAGTVDLSTFIFYNVETNEKPITYLSAGVLPYGASQIEMRAAKKAARNTLAILEAAGVPLPDAGTLASGLQELMKQAKERLKRIDKSLFIEVENARRSIESDLNDHSPRILDSARKKLVQDAAGHNRPEGFAQWKTLKILLGGGGAEERLYRRAIDQWFTQICRFPPPLAKVPVPSPDKLIWPSAYPEASRANAFRRFTVAYGLSFDRADLEDHRFPKDVRPIPQRPTPPPDHHHAPTKDEC